MKKRFVARKKIKIRIKFIYVFLFLLLCVIYYILNYHLRNYKLTNTNSFLLKSLLSESNHYIDRDNKKVINKITNILTGIDFKTPSNTLNNTLYYTSDNNISKYVKNINSSVSKIDTVNKEIKKTNEPRVYIYNTHNHENYSMDKLEAYSITPNVVMASYLLQEKLKNNHIESIVEETDVNDYMVKNKWEVKDSYKVTRKLMQEKLTKYPNLDLLIDIHRDATKHDSSTIKIGNKSYATVLFVIGLEHDNYVKNLSVANSLHSKIEEKYPGLSKGILKKQGPLVNGIYNQDISPKAILIECGGYENKIDEVSNTISVIATIISDYIGG